MSGQAQNSLERAHSVGRRRASVWLTQHFVFRAPGPLLGGAQSPPSRSCSGTRTFFLRSERFVSQPQQLVGEPQHFSCGPQRSLWGPKRSVWAAQSSVSRPSALFAAPALCSAPPALCFGTLALRMLCLGPDALSRSQTNLFLDPVLGLQRSVRASSALCSGPTLLGRHSALLGCAQHSICGRAPALFRSPTTPLARLSILGARTLC